MKPRWDAKDYAANSGHQHKWAKELLAGLALRGDERVLDIGCGDGKVTAEIAELVPAGEVVGVDCSQEMIAFARKHHGNATNLRFDSADARALPYGEEFEVVFSSACLHWVVDHGPVVAGIARALRPGGRFVLAMGGRGNAQQMVEVLGAMIMQEPWVEHFRGFTFPYGFHGPEDYARWCAAADLTLETAKLVPKDMVHEGRDGLAAWFRTTWLPYIQRVPERLRERFIAQAAERGVRGIGTDDAGRIHLRMVRLEVSGRRRAS